MKTHVANISKQSIQLYYYNQVDRCFKLRAISRILVLLDLLLLLLLLLLFDYIHKAHTHTHIHTCVCVCVCVLSVITQESTKRISIVIVTEVKGDSLMIAGKHFT